MEENINKEINDYKETIFFGLTLHQFIAAVLSIGTAVGVYFLCKVTIGEEIASWLCVFAAAPIAASGFFKYNGMNLWQFAWAWFSSTFIMPSVFIYKSVNHCYEEIEKQAKAVNIKRIFGGKKK